MTKTKMCWVCREERSINKFGDGMKCPKTTCLVCLQRNETAKEQARKQKATEEPWNC